MPLVTHEFYVEREVDGELTELMLCVDCDVFPFVPGKTSGPYEDSYPDEGGYAEIAGTIFLVNNNSTIPWDGTLTETEKEKVEEDVYLNWMESKDDRDFDDDDDSLIDEDFFHDERAIRLAGGGKVYY